MKIRNLKNAFIINEINKAKNKVHQLAIIAALLMDEDTWLVCPQVEEQKGIYRVDIFYPSLKWVIEIDEDHHATPEQILNDKNRDDYIKSLGYTSTRIKTYEDDFLHIDAVKQLKNELLKKIALVVNFQDWSPREFPIEQAVKDDPNLIFISRGKSENPFPSFKLDSKFHELSGLKVVILDESNGSFANSNLKMIDRVYDFKFISATPQGGGYINWSGTPSPHSIISSGDTVVNLSSGPYHNLSSLLK